MIAFPLSRAALAAALLATPLPLLAQSPFKAALPANTMVYVGMPDIDRSLAEVEQMPVFKMGREGAVREFLGGVLQMAETEFEQGMAQLDAMQEQGMMPFGSKDVRGLRLASAGLALTSIEVVPGDWGPEPRLGVLGHLDFGSSMASARGMLEFGLQMLAAQNQGDLEFAQSEVAGATLWSSTLPDTKHMTFNVAFTKTGVVFGTLRDQVEGMLKSLESGAANLTASDGYKALAKHVTFDGAAFEMIAQPQQFVDLFTGTMAMMAEAGELPPQVDLAGVERAIDALGLRALQGYAWTTRYEQGRAVHDTFTRAPAPLRKGLFAGANKEFPVAALDNVPVDAATVWGGSLDVAGIYGAITGAMEAYDPDQAAMALEMMKQYEEQVGLSVQQDLFGAFGNHYVAWMKPVETIFAPPSAVALVEMKDPARFLKVVQTMAQMSNGDLELKTVERRIGRNEDGSPRTIELHQIFNNVQVQGPAQSALEIIVPTFGFHDGYMVAALSPGDVRRTVVAMERRAGGEGESIKDNEAFKPYLGQLEGSITGVSFQDWRTTFEGVYNLVGGAVAMLPLGNELPVDMMNMPDVSVMSQHLFGGFTVSRADGEGFHSTGFTPFGPEAVALGVGLLGVGGVLAATRMERGGVMGNAPAGQGRGR